MPDTFIRRGSQNWTPSQRDADGALLVVIKGGLIQVVAEPTTPRTAAANEGGTLFTNEGASEKIVFNLPSAVTGMCYSFFVQDADGIRVVAAAGDTIRLAGSVTIAAGYAESTTIGSTVSLIAINETEWVAVGFAGTWTLETS